MSTAAAAGRHYRSLSDSMVIGAAWVGALGGTVVFLFHLAVITTATITGHPAPQLRVTFQAVRDSLTNPVAGYDTPPGPAWLIYTLTALVVAGVAVGGFWVAVAIGRGVRDRRTGRTTAADMRPIHARAALARARQTTGADGGVADLLVGVGRLGRTALYGQHEDSYALIAPSRSGKTLFLCVPWVLDAPGPVVATGTKNDLLYLTATARGRRGRVWVLDAGRVSGWPDQIPWNPVRGCEEPEEALERGKAWAAGDTAQGGAKNAAWFNARAGEVLSYFLHAAALENLTMRDVMRWAADFADPEPIEILRSGPAETGTAAWADMLRTQTQSRAAETTDSLRMTLSGLLAPLASPRILASLCPPADTEFDAEQFVTSSDTLYLLSGRGASNVAPLVTMLTDHIVRTAQRVSQRQAGGRLNPPLRLVLEEAANVAPLPDLPSIMSDSGGRGITTMVICQSFAQMDDRWGREGAEAIRANATAAMYLPGIKEMDRLRPVSEATGRYRARRVSVSSGQGHASTSTSSEWENVMTPDEIRRMPVGTALVFYRGLKAAHVTLTPWWDREDADTTRAGRDTVEKTTGQVMD